MKNRRSTGWQLDEDVGVRIPSWVGGLLLACGIAAGLWAGWLGWRDSAEIDRNTRFIIRLERALSSLKDLETGQRGFLLTGEERYLDPYHLAETHLDALVKAVTDSGFPTADYADLVAGRRDAATRGIQIFRDSGSLAAVRSVQNGTGKGFMDAIRARTIQFEAEADTRNDALRWYQIVVAVPLGVLSAILLALAFSALGLLALRRRRAQQSSTALLQGVLDNAPVGLGFLDARLRVRHMNRALTAMSERALSAVAGESIWEALPQLREPLEARLQSVVEGGRPVSNLEVAAANTQHGDRLRHFQVSFYPLRTSDLPSGADQGAGMVVLDITARTRSEHRLRESEERFRTLTKAASSIIWVAASDGQFDKPQSEWEAFTGQRFEAHRGAGWLDAIHPDDRAATLAFWDAARATRTVSTIEHRLRRSDGLWRDMAATAVPILDDDGGVREWVGSHADITDRKVTERELAAARDKAEAANRAKSVFLANMSHELRTPLSAVIGYSEMMEEEVADIGEQSLLTDLGKIKSNARHLLSLINDVLDLSKIEANRTEVFVERFDVESVARDVAASVDSLVQKRNNTLELDLAANLGVMETDVVKLRQCLFNLLSNASKFAENGRIVLAADRSTAAGRDWIRFRVTDTGIGMSADQVDRLFERFSQADETTTRKFGGTGLGLAITRAFCHLMGGDITVTSVPGEGSTFTVRLPTVLPAGAPAQGEGTMPATAAARSNGDVLVIDDDPAQRDLMCRFLERQGFAPHAAADGESGLAAARAIKPRAILLDVMMPRKDGWSVLAELKADPDLAAIPVIMVTFVHDTGMGTALGAADYLTKPVHWDKLKAVMDRFREADGAVLIVDDDPEARDRLKAALQRAGWLTEEAANGQEALRQVARAIPRVILLDLTMPVMDGFGFLRALRERPGCADIPVVVLTARDVTDEERQKLEGVDRVFHTGNTSLAKITDEVGALAPPPAAPGDPAV